MIQTRPTKETEAFLKFVEEQCAAQKITLFLSSKDHVVTGNGCKCNGFFDDDSKVLAAAAGKSFDKWFKTLVHEYGHMTQWLDQSPEWKTMKDPADAEVIVELWYDHLIELTPTQLDNWVKKGRDVELDCERRTVELIKKHHLPIDIVEYTQHANSYIYFWTYTKHSRKWYTIGKEPYNIPEIVRAMPAHFDNDYDNIPSHVMTLFKKHL